MSKKSKSILPDEVLAIQSDLDRADAELKIHHLRGEVLNRRKDELKKKLLEICRHPEDYIKDESSYYGGSYYDRAENTRWRVCTVCGCQSEKVTETLSYYG